MTTLFHQLGRPVAGRAAAVTLALGLVAAALVFTSPASAQTSPCSEDVTSAPTGPATVSVASTPSYGRVLVVGSGEYAGCSLYLLTSDQLHALSGAQFACSDNPNVLNEAVRHVASGRRSSPTALPSRGRGSTRTCSER